MQYDYFVSSRWRNRDLVLELVGKLRALGYSAYCFYEGTEDLDVNEHDPDEYMKKSEALPHHHPQLQKIFAKDMDAEKASECVVMLLPAGRSAHIEAGAAYGMGKKCVVIGEIEASESLYEIFEEHYPTIDQFVASLQSKT